MKNIKKLGKRILCGMIAVMSMLSVTFPVYAIERINDMPVSNMKHLLDAKTVTGSDGYYSYDISYTGYAPGAENPGSFGLFYVKDNTCWNMTTVGSFGTVSRSLAISKSANSILYNTGGSGRTNTDYNNGKLTGDTCYASSDGSWIPLKDWFSSNVYLGLVKIDNSEAKPIYNIMVDKYGQSKVDNLLSSYYVWNFANMSSPASDPWQNKDTYETFNYSGKEYDNWVDLLDYLMTDPSFDKDALQEPPKFYLKTYNDYGMNKYSEYTLTWDTKGSFVDGKETDYGFKVYIAKENKPSDAKVLESTELSPCLFSANSLVFTWQDVKDLFSFLSTSKLENRFDVFVQITDKSGKAVSDNYIHFLVVKRMEIRDSNYVDKDGNEQKSYGKWENGQFEYTDGRETSADDKTTNSNGSSTAPSSNVKNDGYTNAENAPSSSNFDASATKSLIKTLDTIVTTLGDVPALLAKVYSWLPVEIITLIGTGIGLIVVVGIAKWLL